MASARSAFQPSAEPMLRVLYWCACHHPSTTPGTVSAAGPPREGMVSLTPCAAYQPIEAARADLPAPQRAASRPAPASWISQKLSPPTPFMCGYTTAIVAAVAIAASSALPPARRAATPLAEASTCGEATMPRGARDSGQRVGDMGRFYIGRFSRSRRAPATLDRSVPRDIPSYALPASYWPCSWESDMTCRRCRRMAPPGAESCPKCGMPLVSPARGRGAADAHPILNAIARTAARLCEARDAQIVLVEAQSLRLVAQHGPLRPNRTLGEPFPLTRGSVYGRAALDRRVIHVRDLKAIARTQYPDIPGTRVRTMLVAPLLSDGAVVGVIALRRLQVRPFTPKQIALLQTFAAQAAIAIANARLFRELREALEQQTATAEILRAISTSTMDAQPVFEAILEAGVRLIGALFGSVYRFDGNLLHMVAHHNYPAAALEFSLRTFPVPPTRQLVTGRAILERAVVHVPDVLRDDERASVQQFAELAGFRSALSMPMLRDGQPIGAITLWHSAPFSDKDIALLKTFADQAVIAVENVRLFKELEARNRDLTQALERETATGEILRVISSSPTDIQPVLEAILDSGKRLCDAEFGAIFRFDGDAFLIAASTMVSSEFSTWLRSHPIRPGPATPLTRVGLEHRPVQVADILADSNFTPPDVYRREGMRTALAVPMLKDGALAGALTFHRHTVQPFTDQQIALLETFAAQAVIAIENVRLFTELEARNHDLTQALEQQTATAEVLRVIGSSPTDAQPVFDAIVSSAWRLLSGFGGAVYRVVGDELHLAAYISTNPTGDAALRRSFPRPLSAFSPPGEAIRRRAPMILTDVDTAEWVPDDIRKIIHERGDWSGVWVPMMREGVALGAIGVTRGEPGGFSDEQIALLRTCGCSRSSRLATAISPRPSSSRQPRPKS